MSDAGEEICIFLGNSIEKTSYIYMYVTIVWRETSTAWVTVRCECIIVSCDAIVSVWILMHEFQGLASFTQPLSFFILLDALQVVRTHQGVRTSKLININPRMAIGFRAILRLRKLTTHVQSGTFLTNNPTPTFVWRSAYEPRARMSTQSIPKIMKGVLVEKTGGVEVLEYRTDLPVPEPKEGQLLIKNEVCGINYIDTFVTPSI